MLYRDQTKASLHNMVLFKTREQQRHGRKDEFHDNLLKLLLPKTEFLRYF